MNMLSAAVILLCSVFAPSSAQEPPGGYYTTRYDHIDIENILNQKRLVHYYAACLMDRGPCTPQGTEFKSILPEAIKTNCLRCTEKQRVVTLRSIRRLKKEYPDVWAQLEKSWDPTGEYVKKLEGSVNRPRPVPVPTTERTTTTTLSIEVVPLGNRFDDGTAEASGIYPPKSTPSDPPRQSSTSLVRSPTEAPTTSTTLSIIISSLQPITTTTRQTTSTTRPTTTSTAKPTTTARITVTRKQTRPFSSIGPNLILPNPKALLDNVINLSINTAGAVLNSVTSVTNTVMNAFKG